MVLIYGFSLHYYRVAEDQRYVGMFEKTLVHLRVNELQSS